MTANRYKFRLEGTVYVDDAMALAAVVTKGLPYEPGSSPEMDAVLLDWQLDPSRALHLVLQGLLMEGMRSVADAARLEVVSGGVVLALEGVDIDELEVPYGYLGDSGVGPDEPER